MSATSHREWPEYCCIIIRDARDRILLERRPSSALNAPSQLTCFGGRREEGEEPRECILRELREELGLDLAAEVEPGARVVLRSAGRIIAWFYAARVDGKTKLRTEPGREAVWLGAEEFACQPVSPWHRAAILAEREGRAEAWVG